MLLPVPHGLPVAGSKAWLLLAVGPRLPNSNQNVSVWHRVAFTVHLPASACRGCSGWLSPAPLTYKGGAFCITVLYLISRDAASIGMGVLQAS